MTFLIVGCSNYLEESDFLVEDYQTIEPQSFETNLKVIDLVVDEQEYQYMFENFTQEIEIDGLFNVYQNNIRVIENEQVEIEVKGNFSASAALKSLGIKFDSSYDNTDRKLINAPTFNFHSIDNIKAVRLRNSGNDFRHTILKDISYTQLAIQAELNLDLTYTEQVVVFLNGSFLGVMNLRTEGNANGMSGLYGVSKSDITLAKVIGPHAVERKDGDADRIDRFIDAVYQKNYDYLLSEIDLDNFIDYIIFESYIGNDDWPINNVRFFAVLNGPFRFVLYDLDNTATKELDKSPLNYIRHDFGGMITDLFNVLYANESFKNTYDTRYDYLVNSGLFDSANFNNIVEDFKEEIDHVMPYHLEKYNSPKTIIEWYIEIEHLKNRFKKREDFVK